MNRAAPFLIISFAAAQAVSWADCCCVLVCRHQGEVCEDCGHEADVPVEPDC
jgi:hypothetical protein